MKQKDSTEKETLNIFKKIRKQESETWRYYNFLHEKENNDLSLEQKDVWIVSDSSTSFANFSHKNYA